MNIILIGMPKSGKTTIAKVLSGKLKCAFIDTDRQIEKKYLAKKKVNLRCRDIFRIEGEEAFRKMENEEIASLHFEKLTIVATGGGALANAENISNLKKLGHLIYLQATPNTLWKRIIRRGFPAYVNPHKPYQSFLQLAQQRSKVYETAADMRVNTDVLNFDEVAQSIIDKLNLSVI